MVVEAGDDVGAAADQRLKRLGAAREILQLDVDALFAVIPQFLRERRRQVDHLALAAYGDSDVGGRPSCRLARDTLGGHRGHKGHKGHKGRKQRKG